MPFADDLGGITCRLHHFAQGCFIWVQTFGRDGLQHQAAAVTDVHVEPDRVAACHQGGAARGANTAGGIVAGEARALFGHAVKIGGAVFRLRIEAMHVAVPEIVAKDKNDVRSLGGECRSGEAQKGEQCFHGGSNDHAAASFTTGFCALMPSATNPAMVKTPAQSRMPSR